MLIKPLILIPMALLVSGCKVASLEGRMDEAAEVPGSWSASPQAKAGIDDRWVERFGGSDLQQAVKEAYQANRDLRAAAARVERAVALARGAGAAARPQIDAVLNGSRDARNFIGFPIPGSDQQVLSTINTSYGAQLTMSWEIDLWKRVRAGQRAALADLEAQGQAHRAARASLAAQVVRSWMLVAELQGQVGLAQEALESRRSMAELVRGRFERAVGGAQASASQLRLVETDVETARANMAARKGELDQALRQLEILLGRYPAAKLTAAARLPAVASVPPAGLPSELLLRRPDILAAERQLAAAGSRRLEAKRAFYPSFSLTGSYGRSSEELRDISDSDFGVWSIGGQVAQPILRRGELKARLKAREAEEREALANLQQVVLNGFGEVETALAAEQFLAARLQAMGQACELATDGADSARREFTRGTGDVLTLLEAENRRIELAAQQLMLRRLRLDNRVTLHLALGGDYTL